MEKTTASEKLIGALGGFHRQFAALTPSELALNALLTLLVIGGAWALAAGFRRLVFFGVRQVPGPSDAHKQVRTTRVARFTRGVVNFGLSVAAVLLAAQVWGLDLAAWLSRGVGEHLVAAGVRVGVLLVIGFAALELAGFVIDRLLGRLVEKATAPRRAAQLNTLGPLLRSFARGAVMVVFAMMILSEAGVQIGPLLAGAGVIGIAIGFGAQTLVKDLLTGIFLIAEDTVSVGDVVSISNFGGLVEEMTLRTIKLRDYDGTLHVFPYSEAQVIHNMTKTFSYYVFNLQVSHASDVDRALQLMKDVGAQMQAEENFSGKILEPIEVVGVDGFTENGVVLKARIKTLPIQQWTVGREYNRRIKQAFAREGVEIPYPHVKLVAPEPTAQAERGRAERGR